MSLSAPFVSSDTSASSRPPLDDLAAERWQRIAERQALQNGAAWLHEEVGRRMAERLQWIKKTPQSWGHWRVLASGIENHLQIAQKYPNSSRFLLKSTLEPAGAASKIIAFENTKKPRWRVIFERFMGSERCRLSDLSQPLPEAGVQMLWANMSLHSESDPAACIKQWHQALQIEGFLMFSCLGPDSLIELRELYARAEWPSPMHPLTDMHDWGDLLVVSGFQEPVMDMERITLQFASAERALAELRGLGRNLHPERSKGLKTANYKRELLLKLEQLRNPHLPERPIELSFEIIYGHAFKPAPRLHMAAESAISMRDMRAMLAQSPKFSSKSSTK